MMNLMKKIRSTLYMETHRVRQERRTLFEPHPDGYLYSGGKYPTKIKAEDLPEWFVHGYIYKSYGFISARGVKHLLYVPNYRVENHLFKYDSLFISYDKEIKPVKLDNGFEWYEGYDHVLDGPIISSFVDAVTRFSDYDTSEVQLLIKEKCDWYHLRSNT